MTPNEVDVTNKMSLLPIKLMLQTKWHGSQLSSCYKQNVMAPNKADVTNKMVWLPIKLMLQTKCHGSQLR